MTVRLICDDCSKNVEEEEGAETVHPCLLPNPATMEQNVAVQNRKLTNPVVVAREVNVAEQDVLEEVQERLDHIESDGIRARCRNCRFEIGAKLRVPNFSRTTIHLENEVRGNAFRRAGRVQVLPA